MRDRIDLSKPYETWSPSARQHRTPVRRKTLIIALLIIIVALAIGATSAFIIITDKNKVLWSVWAGQAGLYLMLGMSILGAFLIYFAIRPNRPPKAVLMTYGLSLVSIALLMVTLAPIALYINSKFDYHPKTEAIATVLKKERSLVAGKYSARAILKITFLTPTSSPPSRTVSVSQDSYQSVSETNLVKLQLGAGLLGIEYIDSMTRLP